MQCHTCTIHAPHGAGVSATEKRKTSCTFPLLSIGGGTHHLPVTSRNETHGMETIFCATHPIPLHIHTYPIDNIRYKYTYVSSIFLYEIKYTYYILFISYIMYSIRKSTRVEFMSFWKGGHHLNVYWMYLLVWVRLNVPRELAVFVGTWPFPNFMLKSGLNGLV